MTKRIQLLDDLGAEVRRIAVEAEGSSRRRLAFTASWAGLSRHTRTAAITVGMVLVLVSGAYALPAARAAVDDITGSFAAWVSGDGDGAPGRALTPDENLPSWFTTGGETRLIAESEGVGLYVRRTDSDRGPWLEFGLGGIGLRMGGTLDDWRDHLKHRAVVVLSPVMVASRDVLDDRGRAPLLGLAAPTVKRVELRYSDGPPLVGDVGDGGFVLLVDAWRPLRELIGYDGRGRLVEQVGMGSTDLTYLCEKAPGACPQ